MKTNNSSKFTLHLYTGLLSILVSSTLVACSGSDNEITPETPTVNATSPTPTPTAPATSVASTPTAEPADKYVGTWVSNCENDGIDSSIGSASFTKISANIFAGTTSAKTYSGTTCAGSVVKTVGLRNMRMTIVGTKNGESTFIQTGPDGALDADGFPNGLNSIKFYKQ